MTAQKTRDYYTRRAAQERDAADRSHDRAARRIHLDLATRYATLVDEDVTTLETA